MADSQVVDAPVTIETNEPLSTPVNATAPSVDAPVTTETNESLSTAVNATAPAPVDAPLTTETNEPPSTPVNTTAPSPQQTPVVHKGTTQVHSMDQLLADEAYAKVAKETKGHYLVGMSPDDFLEEFLPWHDDTPDDYKQKASSKTRQQVLKSMPSRSKGPENAMYPRFVQALDGLVEDRACGLEDTRNLKFTHFNNPDLMCNSMNVDVSAYWSDEFLNNDGSVMDACTFSLQQTHVEFKPDLKYDAFRHERDEGPKTVYPPEKGAKTAKKAKKAKKARSATSPVTGDSVPKKPEDTQEQAPAGGLPEETTEDAKPQVAEDNVSSPSLIAEVEADTQAGIHVRGQIAAYASLVMSMSFRKHFFSMLIIGRFARFIRWDRRGAIVTTRFNYVRRPELILNLYLRFGQLSPAQRGFDTHATRLHPFGGQQLPVKAAEHFSQYYPDSWYDGANFGHQLAPNDGKAVDPNKLPFYRLVVEDPTLQVTQTFFVPAPKFRRHYLNPFSRTSRRSLAFVDDGRNSKMCFFKDSWQEVSSRTPGEADIYRLLHEKGVENIPSMRLGGNVSGLETQTQKWFDKLSHSGRFKKLGEMECHRLVLDTVARDLSTFTWSKVLLSCVADAVDAAQQAYAAGVMHRDISAGNIMIVRNRETGEWRGLLIDWEMSLLLKKADEKRNMRTARTGTWAFISARLLQSTSLNPVVHTLADDMESFFWVLAYQILRYTKHDREPYHLYKLLQDIFSDATPAKGGIVGGSGKENVLQSCSLGRVDTALASLKSSALRSLFTKLGIVFYKRYTRPLNDDIQSDLDEYRISSSVGPPVELDNPEDKWLSRILRDAANKMEPLAVTITGLKTPAKDSGDRHSWDNATISEFPADYHEMTVSKNEFDSSAAQERFSQQAANTFFNHVDISRISSKRQRDDDDEGDNGTRRSARIKKQKSMS